MTDYFSTWDKQLQGISGTMGEAGRKRREESMASFAQLQTRAADLRTQVAPFMTDLKGAAGYLQTDPTASGVKAATPTLRGALAREPEVVKNIDEMIAHIDVVRGGR